MHKNGSSCIENKLEMSSACNSLTIHVDAVSADERHCLEDMCAFFFFFLVSLSLKYTVS